MNKKEGRRTSYFLHAALLAFFPETAPDASNNKGIGQGGIVLRLCETESKGSLRASM